MTIDATAGWYGTTGRTFREVEQPTLGSPQYGPAWVADHVSDFTHEDRVAALKDGVSDPELLDHLLSGDRDDVARAFFRLITGEYEDTGDAGELFQDGCS